MFHTPDDYYIVSNAISEVLNDIGVNEDIVIMRRKAMLLRETIDTLARRAIDEKDTVYKLGSLSEGTTTVGMNPDSDTLYCMEDYLVIQDWCEWTSGKTNFLMVQNEATPPGYCLLQILRRDAPLPDTAVDIDGNDFVKDTSGRILCKNTVIDAALYEGLQRHGPAVGKDAKPGFISTDCVLAFPCNSWPQTHRVSRNQQEANCRPTSVMKRYAGRTKCFVVGVGSKASENANFEWRISTSLAERCFMFSLNITQIRCYVLMKMIMKTFINIENESYISSYMCKTVLFHCIASKPLYQWKENNILNCLNFCLLTLKKCIQCGNCPHFIAYENNLLAGKLPAETKQKLLEKMSNFLACKGIAMFDIPIDDLGLKLQAKLGMINVVRDSTPNYAGYDIRYLNCSMVLYIARDIVERSYKVIYKVRDERFELKLIKALQQLTRFYRNGDTFEKTASKLLAPLLCSSIGSLLASRDIETKKSVSHQALAWFEAGKNSDATSSRLKLASVWYCINDMERTAVLITDTEERYHVEVTQLICGCYQSPILFIRRRFIQLSSQYGEDAVKHIVSFCVVFLPNEINCVPHELKYEMFRSTVEDESHSENLWMDCAVVDSPPFLYFLQYKLYGNLQRQREQRQALNKLKRVIETEPNLKHKETALNLLGQCMEEEDRPIDALHCYRLSLEVNGRNNAAKFHICSCLAKMFS